MLSTEKVLEAMYDKLDNFLKTETVIGETIDLGEVKLIPIITASFGFGGGMGEEDNAGSGGGGVGCNISPDAILVVRGNEVEMMPVKNKGSLDKLIEKVPSLIDKIEATSLLDKIEAAREKKGKNQKKEEAEVEKEE